MRTPRLLAAILFAACAARGLAGPPFIAHDPEPVDYRHWEVYLLSLTSQDPDRKHRHRTAHRGQQRCRAQRPASYHHAQFLQPAAGWADLPRLRRHRGGVKDPLRAGRTH